MAHLGSTVRISVIIPTYQRTQLLRDTVASLRQQTLTDGFEILVVDNAPSNELREYVGSLAGGGPPAICYVPEPRTGLHNARHAGARAAQGEILVYVDDDVLVPPGWLEAVCTPYADSQVACVGGKILPKWEAEPPSWLSTIRPGYLSLLDLGHDVRDLAWPETVYGCNMSVRKSVLFEVGGFNPDGFGDRSLIWHRGDGETGLQRKVYNADYKVVYVSDAWLYHRVPASRLTPAYFRRRAFDQGISESYAVFRENPSLIRVLRRMAIALFCYMRRGITAAVEFNSEVERIHSSIVASQAQAQILHSLRLLASPSLRQYVLRENYL